MKFLNKVLEDVLDTTNDLSNYTFVIPGKRPVVFIKKILVEKKYNGFLPDFFTIEEIIGEISGRVQIQGIALWLVAFEFYKQMFDHETFDNFIKWFPTLVKDWDDMMKFSSNDQAVLGYMLDEERIKNWGEQLGEENARTRNLDFWKKMVVFLPAFKKHLLSKNWATSGMLHQEATKQIEEFSKNSKHQYVFIGFNAFTPVEERLVRSLLQWDKALCYFQADEYYINDKRQEAGAFLRQHMLWKEFNESRSFKWIESDFTKPKNIKVYEVPGNITQTKILSDVFKQIPSSNLEDTALILLDENLLPATLDSLSSIDRINITMGFPLKNLDFSNAVEHLFHLQKQLAKNPKSYYYNDILAILESIPETEADIETKNSFMSEIKRRNMVYISSKKLEEMLGELSYFNLFKKYDNAKIYLQLLSDFCFQLKFSIQDDIIFENISHFEKSFKIIQNLIDESNFDIQPDTLEVLMTQVISNETLDFQGEPLEGLQIMGLLETRLLNFKNIILLSINEGKLPLGNTQNTYLPFDVRSRFDMHTYLENDSIYAYHFYRFIQDSENVFLMFNGLSSGVNTGEKSRFITQLELESPHNIEEIVVETKSEPIENDLMVIEKTPAVMNRLLEWKQRISATHLTSYLYDPIQFYLNYVLKTKESNEIEEELSSRNYGNLVHYSLEYLYAPLKGKVLQKEDLEIAFKRVDEALLNAINVLEHQLEFYERGMNYVYKSIAKKVIEKIIKVDLNLVKKGSALEIIDVERKIEDVNFVLNEKTRDSVSFMGYIDRLDLLDGVIRVIDYKTGKAKKLKLEFKKEEDVEVLLMKDDYKQAIQLAIYLYYINHYSEFKGKEVQAGIWSFGEASKGIIPLEIINGDSDTAMESIKNIILEILNPELQFIEKEKINFSIN